MRRVFAIAALAILTVGCTDGSAPSVSPPTAGTVSVEGVALAGPTCPVVTDPPDPACEDRPVAGARVRVLGPDGSEVAILVTDDEGRFSIELAPGSYELVPQPVTGLMGTAAPVTIDVEDGVEAEPVTLAYDTGIR